MLAGSWRIRAIAGCGLLLAVCPIGMTAAAKPSATAVATFWFEDGFDLAGDGLGAETPSTLGLYKDYRLATAGTDDINYCVEAGPDATGLFIRLNRKLDGDAGFQYCDTYAPPSTTRLKRDITLHIRSAVACEELENAPPGYVTSDGGSGCYFGHFAKPRIRISADVFGKRTTSTPVSFLEKSDNDSDISYEVQTDANAAVTANNPTNPNQRRVFSMGTAHLVKFVPGEKSSAVGASFPLTFSIILVRTTVQ
jgi:hypothetical protein